MIKDVHINNPNVSWLLEIDFLADTAYSRKASENMHIWEAILA